MKVGNDVDEDVSSGACDRDLKDDEIRWEEREREMCSNLQE